MFNREKERSVTLYCFTPGVSLATFFIETIFALYVAFRYKMSAFGRLSALLLLLLGTFQLAGALPAMGAPLGSVIGAGQ